MARLDKVVFFSKVIVVKTEMKDVKEALITYHRLIGTIIDLV